MASVTGMAVAAIEEQLDTMITNITLDEETGILYAEPRSGDPIAIGPLVSPTLAVEAAWPVGSIYINAAGATNPATLLGVGTWERYGKGKTIVSLNEAETEFDSLGETGGAKTHQLTVAQMPVHNHTGTVGDTNPTANFNDLDLGSNPASGFGLIDRAGTGGGFVLLPISGAAHSHSLTINNKGGDEAHPILSPYIVAYIWRRTA